MTRLRRRGLRPTANRILNLETGINVGAMVGSASHGPIGMEGGNLSKDVDTDKDEVHLPKTLGSALRTFIDLPIAAAMKSPHRFIKAFSLVDDALKNEHLKPYRDR
jgi:hypothetical protein